MKLCKDCKHFIDSGTASFDRCGMRRIEGGIDFDLVRGNTEERPFGFCKESRAEWYCGRDAKWFEPKDAT